MTRPPVAPSASAAYMPGAGGEQLYTLIEGDPEPRGVVWYVLGPELANVGESDVALDTSRRGSYTAGLIVVGVLAVGLGAFFLFRALGLG